MFRAVPQKINFVPAVQYTLSRTVRLTLPRTARSALSRTALNPVRYCTARCILSWTAGIHKVSSSTISRRISLNNSFKVQYHEIILYDLKFTRQTFKRLPRYLHFSFFGTALIYKQWDAKNGLEMFFVLIVKYWQKRHLGKRCPGECWVKLSAVRDSVESSWVLSGTASVGVKLSAVWDS